MTEILDVRRPRAATSSAASGARAHSGARYEKRSPWRPSEVIGELPGLRRRGRARGGRRRPPRRFPDWAAPPGAGARGVLLQGRRRDRARASSRSPRT